MIQLSTPFIPQLVNNICNNTSHYWALCFNGLLNPSNKMLSVVISVFQQCINDVASGSEITPCNKIDKPLVDYRFSETLPRPQQRCVANDKSITFLKQK